uniref:Uncharacterized protein n=1 Tax=Ditylenchus dipsaci TaxID=166011 RepID=A0A915E3N6_9BILA
MNDLLMNPLIGSRQFCAIWKMIDLLNQILSRKTIEVREKLSYEGTVVAFERSCRLLYLGRQFYPMPDRLNAFGGASQAMGRLNASRTTEGKHMWMLKDLLERAFGSNATMQVDYFHLSFISNHPKAERQLTEEELKIYVSDC